MANEGEFIKILWGNIVGETREQIESLSWEGIATYVIDQTGQLVITSLVPVGGFVTPIYSLIVNTVGKAVGKTFKEWGEMQVHLSDKKTAVFEKPPSLLTSSKPNNREKTIVLPIPELIKPSSALRLQPTLPSATKTNASSRYDLLPSLRQQSRERKQTPTRGNIKVQSILARRSKNFSSIANDVLYPEWAITGKLPQPGKSARLLPMPTINPQEMKHQENLVAAAAVSARNLERIMAAGRKMNEDAIKRSRDLADRHRKQQEQLRQQEARRREQQRNNLHRKR